MIVVMIIVISKDSCYFGVIKTNSTVTHYKPSISLRTVLSNVPIILVYIYPEWYMGNIHTMYVIKGVVEILHP